MRTLDRAREILREERVTDPEGLAEDGADEDALGCSVQAHRAWIRSAYAKDLRGWAQDWARGLEE